MDKITFNSPLGVRMDMEQVVEEIKRFAQDDPRYKYAVIIGTDSEAVNEKEGDFVTAIVVRRIGNGGKYFWRRFKQGPFHTLRNRIINEVMISLELAKQVLEELSRVDDVDFQFEVHVDIGNQGKTREMMNEVAGMIRAYNFEYKTKPESYAASSVADKHV